MYAVHLPWQFCGQCLKSRLKNPNVGLAFLLMLLIWVFNFRSSEIWDSRYGLFCTLYKICPFSVYKLFAALVFNVENDYVPIKLTFLLEDFSKETNR